VRAPLGRDRAHSPKLREVPARLPRHEKAPTLVIHGDSDAIVPYEVSGKRSAELIEGARLVVIKDAPHGFNASHAEEFNQALLSFLAG